MAALDIELSCTHGAGDIFTCPIYSFKKLARLIRVLARMAFFTKHLDVLWFVSQIRVIRKGFNVVAVQLVGRSANLATTFLQNSSGYNFTASRARFSPSVYEGMMIFPTLKGVLASNRAIFGFGSVHTGRSANCNLEMRQAICTLQNIALARFIWLQCSGAEK